MANLLLNILTFGAAERIEDAQYEYEETCDRYNEKIRQCKNIQNSYKRYVKNFVELQQKSQQEAMKVCLFVPADIKQRKTMLAQLGMKHEKITAIEHTLDTAEIFQNYAKILSQAAMAANSVSAIGMTTTVSLASGAMVAGATPAALANSGIMAGTVALNAATPAVTSSLMALGASAAASAIPVVNVLAVVAMPIVSHVTASRQISELESEMYNLEEEMGNLNKTLLKFKRYKKRMAELCKTLKTALKSFSVEYEKSLKLIYPDGITETTVQKDWQLYTDEEQQSILNLITATYEMLKIRNAKISGAKR